MHRRENFWERVRVWLWPKLHWLAQAFGAYTVGTTGEEQFVGTVDYEEEEFEEVLAHELDFEWNAIACLKSNDGEWSKGTWSERDASDERYWDGDPHPNWPDLLTDYQLHVTLFEGETGIDVYAHFEKSYWRHPFGHLKGHGLSPEMGVEMMQEILDEHDIDYDTGDSTGGA